MIDWPGVGGIASVTASSPRTVRVPVAYTLVKNKDFIFGSGFGLAVLGAVGWIFKKIFERISKRIPQRQIVGKIKNNYKVFSGQDFTLRKIELNANNEADMFDVNILYSVWLKTPIFKKSRQKIS